MSRIVDVEPLDCLTWKDGEHGTTFDDGVSWLLSKIDELPAVQPETHDKRTEERTETHACDCIERQAAIDALDVLCQEHRYKIPGKWETYSQYNEAWQDALDRAEGAIGNLPSAQPEKRTGKRMETHTCDLVDRQAAIDAAIKADMRNNDGILSEKRARVLDEYISRLPSVQPEHDYKKAFSVACELLIGANLFGITEETMFKEIMEKDGIVSSLGYERYILDNLARLTGDE